MAMYVMEEMPDIHGTGEQVLYPRFAMMEQVSTEDLIRQIASSRCGRRNYTDRY